MAVFRDRQWSVHPTAFHMSKCHALDRYIDGKPAWSSWRGHFGFQRSGIPSTPLLSLSFGSNHLVPIVKRIYHEWVDRSVMDKSNSCLVFMSPFKYFSSTSETRARERRFGRINSAKYNDPSFMLAWVHSWKLYGYHGSRVRLTCSLPNCSTSNDTITYVQRPGIWSEPS